MQGLIQHGAKHIVVPGNLPTGCIPIALTLYASPNKSDYDQHGCLKKLNGLAHYHNALLLNQVELLRNKQESAYRSIAEAWLRGPYADPPILSVTH